jgi:hypothetical protein
VIRTVIVAAALWSVDMLGPAAFIFEETRTGSRCFQH